MLCSQHDAVLAAYHSPLLDGEDLADPAAAASGTGTLGYTSSSAGNGNIGSSFAEIEEADAANGEGAVVGQAAGSGGVLTPALAAVLRPVYAAACPAALAALAGSLPPPATVVATPASRSQFHRLLEVALMLLTDASARLAHAVAAALRSAGPAGGIDLASLPPGAGAAAAAAASMWSSASPRVGASHHHGGGNADGSFAHVRDTAMRLAGVLRALQRLLAAGYVGAAAPADAAPTSTAAAAASAGAQQPLVPAAVLRDVLRALGGVAVHALMPLHWALLAGQAPAALAGLLPGLALPCCAMVRELCGAAPEDSLQGPAAVPLSALSSEAAAAAAGEGGEADHEGEGTDAEGEDGAGPGPGGSVAAAAVETVLLFTSVCCPFACERAASNGPAGSSGRGEGNGQGQGQGLPPWMGPLGEAAGGLAAAPGCLPLPAPAPEQATALAQCTAQALGAAQLLLRRCPWSALQPHVGPLLELPLRLLLTCASGAAVAPVAQRYMENAVAALGARTGAGTGGDAAASCAAAAVAVLCDTLSRHVAALQAAAGKAAGPEPEAALVQSRLATLAAACLGCGAALSAAEQQPPRPAVAAARGTVVAALTAPLAPEVPPAAALAVLEAARGAVQESVAEDAASARGRWARLLVAALVGPAVVRVGPLLTEAKAPLSGEASITFGTCYVHDT